MWVQMTLKLFYALRLVRGADYLQVVEAGRVQALASLYLGGRFDQYYVGLLFCPIGIDSLQLLVLSIWVHS